MFLHFLFFFFWLASRACRILVRWPGIEPKGFVVEALSFRHWAPRETSVHFLLTSYTASAIPGQSFPFWGQCEERLAASWLWYLA